MKKIFSFICVCTILLSANATIITAPQAEALPLPVLQPKAAKAPQVRQATQDATTWEPMGTGKVTERFVGSLFTSTPTKTYNVGVYHKTSNPGEYLLYDPYATSETVTPVHWIIHAENPEYVYFTPITTSWEVIAGDVDYGSFLIRNMGGLYLEYYEQYGYTAEEIFEGLGAGLQYWGKRSKNVITFGSASLQAGLSNYNGAETWWSVTENFVIELPDTAAPVISNVEVQYAGNVSAVIAITADDDADDVDSLTFTVMNGEEAILSNGKTTNGRLMISGLTANTAYNLTLQATDRAGHVSEAYPFALTTEAEGDTDAPVMVSAQIHELSDKWVTIRVNATDNVTDSAHMVFVVTAVDQSVQELVVTTDSLITIEGLTPSTAYSFTIAAKDLAGNIGNALPIQFTTQDLIPIVFTINSAEAQYYEEYHVFEGRYDFYFRFNDAQGNNVSIDVYTAALNAISGTYTSDDYINLSGTQVKYNGRMIRCSSVSLTLEFVSLNYETIQGTYNLSFAVMAEDGNRYTGTATLEVPTYYRSNGVVYYLGMNGDLGYETLSVAQAMEIGRSLEKGASTTETYVITGYVAAIESEYDETYHNQNYWISDQRGGNVSEVFYIYRGNNANAVQVGNMVSIVTKIYRYADQVIENKGNDCPVIILDHATSAVPTILVGNCGAEGNNLTCQLNMSTWDLTIQGSGRMIDSAQYIPWQWQSVRNKILTIQLPEGLTSIGMSAFDYCQKVTSVPIPEGVTSIGKRAFHYCKALTTMNMPESVDSIGLYAFVGCALTEPLYNSRLFCFLPKDYSGSYTIPDGIVMVVSYAFEDRTGLTSVDIPASVLRLGYFTFYGCTGLQSITCRAIDPPSSYGESFVDVDKSIPLYVPEESISDYQTADEWKEFTNIQPISGTTAIESTSVDTDCRSKILRDGQIVILRGGKIYTIQGQEVK